MKKLNTEKKENLIQRLYRISKNHDKCVKFKAVRYGGESAYIRHLIDKDRILR